MNNSLLVLSFIFLVSAVYGAVSKIEKPANISRVRNFNFEEFNHTMQTSDFLVMCFNSKQSRTSSEFSNMYDEVANAVYKENSKIVFGEIDIQKYHQVEKVHYIYELPMLKFYKKGRYYDYKGAKSVKHITTWIHMAMNVPLVMSSQKELEDLQQRGTVIVGCFLGNQPTDAFNTFMNVSARFLPAKTMPLPKFALITKASVSRDLGITKGTVAIYKSFEFGEKVVYPGSSTDPNAMLKFCEKEGQPTVFQYGFNEYSQRTLHSDIRQQHLLFMSPKDSRFKKAFANFKAAAKEFMKSLDEIEVIFVHVNTDDKHIEKATGFFHVDIEKDVPCNRITKKDENSSKFKPEKMDFTKEGFIDFTRQVLAGKLKRSIKSDVLPGDWNKYPLKVLVGTNYKEITRQKGNIMFVMYYIPENKDCEIAKPIMDEVAMKYKLNTTVTLATMDVSKNDGETDVFYDFPNFKMFTAENQIKKFRGTVSVEAIQRFIDSNGTDHMGADFSKHTEVYDFEVNDIHIHNPNELNWEEEENREHEWTLEEQKMIENSIVLTEGHQAHDDPAHMVNPDHHEMQKQGIVTDHNDMDPKEHAKLGDNETLHHDPDEHVYGHAEPNSHTLIHQPGNGTEHEHGEHEHHDL